MNHGVRLCRIREALGLKQKQVAHELGVSHTTYSRMESEKAPLRFDRAAKLARLFRCSLDDFDELLGGPIDQVLAKVLMSRAA